MAATEPVKPAHLQLLKPFSEMKPAQVNSVAAKCRAADVPKGKILFKHGQENTLCHWLLIGSVDLLDPKYNVTPVKAGSERGVRMLDSQSPHSVTAVTAEDCRIIVMDKRALDMALTVDQGSSLIVADAATTGEENQDWMAALLDTHLFELLPPANIQKAFSRFEEVKVTTGQKIIEQGAEGDYFYVLKQGEARIYREDGGKVQQLAQIGPGTCFGEDALVSDAPRNATIEMTTSGAVMRLDKPDFQALLQKPATEYVSMEEVDQALMEGEQKLTLLDVRMPGECADDMIDGAINIPLADLRDSLEGLAKDTTYITCCDGGRRSELAAYILNENGYDAVILKRN